MGKLLKVAILFGGQSVEHDISILSARSILQHLDRSYYEPVPVYVDRRGIWHSQENLIQSLLVDDESNGLSNLKSYLSIEPNQSKIFDIFRSGEIDIVFPVFHGEKGEDGAIQGFCEVLGVPYVGADITGSAIAIDKELSKQLAILAGVPVVPYITLHDWEWRQSQNQWIKIIREKLTFPLFTKPAKAGSSLGVTRVKDLEHLIEAIDQAFSYDNKILIEKAINCREIEIGVLTSLNDLSTQLISLPGEVITDHEFYSYDAKYIHVNGLKMHVPADLSGEQISSVQLLAGQIFRALDCKHMARIDFFWDRDNGHFMFNEINTIPGFTKNSMYPLMMASIGIDYQQLVSHLIQLGLISSKHKHRKYSSKS